MLGLGVRRRAIEELGVYSQDAEATDAHPIRKLKRESL